jgi:hypothetical protein
MANGQGRWGVKAKAPVVVSGNDTDAQAFIAAAGITDNTQRNAINTLVTNLKTYGIWSKMKAIYPFVGGTATTHKFNLKDTGDSNAAFRLQFNGGGTHDSNGYNMNGTNAYADTYFNPSLISGFNNNNHYSIYLKTETPVGGGWHIGVGNTNTANPLFGFAARRNMGGGVYNEIFDSGNNSQNGRLANSVTDGRGFFIGSKTAANSRAIYRNSTQILSSSLTVTSVTPPNDVMYIGAMKGSSGSSNLYLGGINSFTTIGDGLTDTEAANFYSAVQIFQSTLGRHEGVPIVSDTDAQAFLNAAVITNTTQASAVNTLVTSLKSYGIWSKLKAIYPFVGGTATTHKFNLKNPADSNAAFRLGFYGGMTHDSNGVSFGGSNGGAYTYFNPFLNQAKNDLHMSVYARIRTAGRFVYSNDIQPNRLYVAAGWTTLRATSTTANTSEFIGTSDTAEGVAVLNGTSVGFSLGSRTSSTAIKYYKNTTSASGNGASHTNDFVSNELTLNGNPGGGYYSVANYAFASLGNGLTDAEAANFYTAVQAFQTTLGRQV